jgi:hypothetical protein
MFRTKELTLVGLMGALMFTVSFLFGSVLNVALGNPAASGFITTFLQSVILVITALILRKFWTATFIFGIYGVLAIPTNMLGGLPGIFKVVLGLLIGFIFDVVVYLCRYKRWGMFLGLAVTYVSLAPLFMLLYSLLGMPGLDRLIKVFPIMVAIFLVEAMIGAWVGMKIFDRIKNKRAIRQIVTY